jgi:hypothetical protein
MGAYALAPHPAVAGHIHTARDLGHGLRGPPTAQHAWRRPPLAAVGAL